jgi:hypothetical protein
MDELTQAQDRSKAASATYETARKAVLAQMRSEGRHHMTNAEHRSLNALHKTSSQLYQAYWQARTKVERNAD